MKINTLLTPLLCSAVLLSANNLLARRNKQAKPQAQMEAVVEEQIIEVMPKKRPEIQGHVVKSVGSMEEFDQIINSTPLVFVDFWSKSCGICELMKPDIQELSLEYKDKVTFLSVNLGLKKFMPLGQDRYKITGLPTYLLLLNGKRFEIMTGSQIKEGIRIYLDKMIKQASKEGVSPQPTKVQPGQTAAEAPKPKTVETKTVATPKGPISITIETDVAMTAEVTKTGKTNVIELKEQS